MNFYRFLIKFYPEEFQRQHGEEMEQTFKDMLRDSGPIYTWIAVLPDFLCSVIKINFENFMQTSTLQFKLAMWGIIMLLPFAFLVLLAMISSALHLPVNDLVGGNISEHLLLAKFILIALPSAAFFMNLAPLVTNIFEQKPIANTMTLSFVRANILSLLIALGGLGALVFIFGHDAVPCFSHGLINSHFHNIGQLFNTCKNA